MKKFNMVVERLSFYGINVCEECLRDIEFIMSEGRIEGKRKGEVLEILKREKGGIGAFEIGEELGLKKENVNSIIMELRRKGVEIYSINRKYILSEFVNIGG